MDGILYEDVDILVCRKKAGIPVQSARLGQRDMVSELNNYLAEKPQSHKAQAGKGRGQAGQQGDRERIYVVHRLDQPVEGVMVFGKTKRAAAELSRQVGSGGMRKVYRAVCCEEEGREGGRIRKGSEETLVDYLVKDGKTNTSQVVKKEEKEARRAELSYRVLNVVCLEKEEEDAGQTGLKVEGEKREQRYVLAEIDLKTGRHHQIRVQMANAGLPLYGDQKYNKGWKDFRICSDQVPSLALCAVSLSFRHPVTKKKMEFHAEPENQAFAPLERV